VNAKHGGSWIDSRFYHTQCVRDGKSFVIEGLHLDPGLYLHEFGRHGLSRLGDAVPAAADISAQMPSTDSRGMGAAAISIDATASLTTAAQPPLGEVTQHPARAEDRAVGRSQGAAEQPTSVPEPAARAADQQQPEQRSDDAEALQANQHEPAQHIGTGIEQACPSGTVDEESTLDGSMAAMVANEVVPSAVADSTPLMGLKTGHRRPTEVLRDRVRCGPNGLAVLDCPYSHVQGSLVEMSCTCQTTTS